MHILLAVNDSPAAIAATRSAIRLAQISGATIRAVQVVPDGAPAPPRLHPGAGTGGPDILRFVADRASGSGVPVETLTLHGPAATAILEQASAWPADLIVLGRSGVRHVGQPFVGSSVLYVLEFSDIPVMVVPAVRSAAAGSDRG